MNQLLSHNRTFLKYQPSNAKTISWLSFRTNSSFHKSIVSLPNSPPLHLSTYLTPVKMPPKPTFDYYEELQIKESASAKEITAAFHRLALKHHPDRNPGNQQQATASFQRIQEAYETLSGPAKRDHYDEIAPPPPPQPSSPTGKKPHNKKDDYWTYSQKHEKFFNSEFSEGDLGFSYYFGHLPKKTTPSKDSGPQFEHQPPRCDAFERDAIKTQRWRDVLAEMYENKTREDEVKRGVYLKNRQKMNTPTEKVAPHLKSEKRIQEEIWMEKGAEIKESKTEICLHSHMCRKFYTPSDFECVNCGNTSGIWAHECPYCSDIICTACYDTYMWRRASQSLNRQYATVTRMSAGQKVPHDAGGPSRRGRPISQCSCSGHGSESE